MSAPKKVSSVDVPYKGMGMTNPFATASYNAVKNGAGSWNVAPSEQTGKQLDLSQSQLYDVIKQLPTAGPLGLGNSFANSMNDPNSFLGGYGNAYKSMMDYQYGTPLSQANAQKGLGDSTIGGANMNNFNMQVGNNMWQNAINAANSNYNGMLSGMTGLGANINDIYNKLYGTQNQALAGTQQWLNNEQQNAARDFQANVANTNASNQSSSNMWNAMADAGLVAASIAFPEASPALLAYMSSTNGQPLGGSSQASAGGGNTGGGNGFDWSSFLNNQSSTNPSQYQANQVLQGLMNSGNTTSGAAGANPSDISNSQAVMQGLTANGFNPTMPQLNTSYGGGWQQGSTPNSNDYYNVYSQLAAMLGVNQDYLPQDAKISY